MDSTLIGREAQNPTVEDIYDVLRRLRPQMLGDYMRKCADIQFVWINGVRYRLDETLSNPPIDVLRDPRTHARKVILEPWDLLAGIHPMDVASVQYLPCRDTSMPGIGAENALYITLKPGVAFDEKRGTYRTESADSNKTPHK